jgi:hypothetical protein
MFRIFDLVTDSEDVLICRLVGGKVTFVHRRVWPALARLAPRLPRQSLDAIRQEHTKSGQHRNIVTPFPRWVPASVLQEADRMSEEEATDALGADLLSAIAGKNSRAGQAARAPR